MFFSWRNTLTYTYTYMVVMHTIIRVFHDACSSYNACTIRIFVRRSTYGRNAYHDTYVFLTTHGVVGRFNCLVGWSFGGLVCWSVCPLVVFCGSIVVWMFGRLLSLPFDSLFGRGALFCRLVVCLHASVRARLLVFLCASPVVACPLIFFCFFIMVGYYLTAYHFLQSNSSWADFLIFPLLIAVVDGLSYPLSHLLSCSTPYLILSCLLSHLLLHLLP